METINDVKVSFEALNNRHSESTQATTQIHHRGEVFRFHGYGADMLTALIDLKDEVENHGFMVQFYDIT